MLFVSQVISTLVRQIHSRDSRRPFCVHGHWLAPNISMQADKVEHYRIIICWQLIMQDCRWVFDDGWLLFEHWRCFGPWCHVIWSMKVFWTLVSCCLSYGGVLDPRIMLFELWRCFGPLCHVIWAMEVFWTLVSFELWRCFGPSCHDTRRNLLMVLEVDQAAANEPNKAELNRVRCFWMFQSE